VRARARIRRGLVSALGSVLLLAGCAERLSAPDVVALERIEFTDLTGWAEDDPSGALGAFARSCAAVLARDPARSMGGAGFAGTAGDWQPGCTEARAMIEAGGVDKVAARGFFERAFAPYQVFENGTSEGLFTGYYEPELRGALGPGGAYQVALYARPPDLVELDLGAFRDELKGERIAGRVEGERFVPYADRAQIASGALNGDGLELVWVDDAVAAFFLHIQGSGRIVFENGQSRRIGYAASNGHVYYAIGRALVERGALSKDEVSLQTIRAWLGDHPDEAAAVMALNSSYVFFRWLPGDGSEPGPLGAANVPLTPGRSLAVDRRILPLGAPLWLATSAPLPGGGEAPLRRLMIAQDTGGAIRGAVRGDLFWGAGAEAERIAGHMRQTGNFALLLPRALAAVLGERAEIAR
jgi:membrane-bound lytic murein transglycosylase A